MKSILFFLIIIFQVNTFAYNGEEGCTGPIDFEAYEAETENEQLIILNRFILSGLCYRDINEQSEALFQRQEQAAQRFVDTFNGCQDRLLVAARVFAWNKIGYGAPEAEPYSTMRRSRYLVQAIDRICPPAISTNNVTAYIYGEDIFNYDQIRRGLTCSSSNLFVMGLRLRYIRDLSYEDFVERFRLRYVSSEISEQRFSQLGERRLQVQRDLERNCHVAMEEDNSLRRRYEGEVVVE